MPDTRPTIAVVNAYAGGVNLVREMVALGARCVHVRAQESIADYYRRTYREELFVHDLGYDSNEQSVVERLRELRVHSIVPGAESGVTLAEHLADVMSLPTNDPATTAARRDKYAATATLVKAGLDAPRAVLSADVESAVAWFGGSGLGRVVVKPTGGAGSENVSVCNTAREVRRAALAILSGPNAFGEENSQVLVQEYLSGRELYVNAISSLGQHRVTEIWQYTKSDGPEQSRIFDYEEPLSFDDELYDVAWRYSNRALDALGFKNGPSHLEIIVQNGIPLLIDTGARLGGGVDPTTCAQLAGSSHARRAALQVLGLEQRDVPLRYPERTRYVSLINPYFGYFAADIEDLFSELTSIVSVQINTMPGESVVPTCNLRTSPGYCYLSGDEGQVEADYGTIRRWERAGRYVSR